VLSVQKCSLIFMQQNGCFLGNTLTAFVQESGDFVPESGRF